MPASFETLPNNVLQRIFDHTRGPTEKRTFKTKLGLSISLVCRSLRQYGQEMVWRAPVLNYSKISSTRMSIFHDFEQLKHLHPFVKVFIITSHRGISIPFLETKPSPSQVTEKFLKHCQDLRVLSISIASVSESDTANIFSLASSLPYLESACFSSLFPIKLNNHALRKLVSGFPLTTLLSLTLNLPASLNSLTAKKLQAILPRPSPIQELEIDVEGDPEQIPSLLDVFDSAFDSNSLDKFECGSRFLNCYSLVWLTTCPALRNISLSIEPDELLDALPCILALLPKLPHVITLAINRKMSNRDHLDKSPLSRIPFSSVLSAIPTSLYIFSIKGIHFRGPLSYPQLRIKRSLLSQTEGPTVQCYFEESVSKQLVRLKKMRDSKGVLRWYQIIEVGLVLSP